MKTSITIAIGSDHAGFKIKQKISDFLKEEKYCVNDCGTSSEESVDYPDYAHLVAKLVENGKCEAGIVVCGSGNGVNMVVNKYQDIRGALCWNEQIAYLARAHNNANILALPGRFLSEEEAIKIVEVFLNTSFEDGRHEARVKKIPIEDKTEQNP